MNQVGGRRFSPLTAVDLPTVALALTGFLHGRVNLLVTSHGALSGVTFWKGRFTITVRQDDWAKIELFTKDGTWGKTNPRKTRHLVDKVDFDFKVLDPELYSRILVTLEGLFP